MSDLEEITYEITNKLERDNNKTIESFVSDLGQYYTGRATPRLLSNIKVNYYGSLVRLEDCGVIHVQSFELLVVKPWEASLTKEIERAIHAANIGLNPQSDGEVVKVYLPQKTQAANLEIFSLMKKRGERAKVSIRQNRKRARSEGKYLIPAEQDGVDRKIQTITDNFIKNVDALLISKKEAMRL